MVGMEAPVAKRWSLFARKSGRPGSARAAARGAGVALALGVPVAALATAGDWVELGPEGGRIQALAMAPSDPSTVFAGTYGNGVFRSRDGGASWTPARDGMGRAVVTALAVDSHAAGRVFAGTADGRVFASEDGGASWASATGTGAAFPAGKPIAALALDGAQPPTVWAAAGVQVFRSADLGRSWSASTPPTAAPDNDEILSLAVNPRRPGEVWVGMWQGLFKSADSGATWTEAKFDGHSLTRSASVTIDPVDPDTVFASTGCSWCGESSFPHYMLMRSPDSGASWTATGFPAGIANGPPLAIIVDPGDIRHLVAAGPSSVRVSRDGGATWPSGSYLSAEVLAGILDPTRPDRILAATDGGVRRSDDDGAHWVASDQGLQARVSAPSPSRGTSRGCSPAAGIRGSSRSIRDQAPGRSRGTGCSAPTRRSVARASRAS